jgi:hypothetical protein
MTGIIRTALLGGLLAATPLCAGAAAPPAEPVAEAGAGLTIVDQRPAKEKKERLWSVWIWNCNFGVFNVGDGGIGDERLANNRIGDLRRYLEARLGDRLAGRTLALATYRIIVNGNARAKAYSGRGLGVVEAAMGDGTIKKAKCSREDMAAGWFDMSQIGIPIRR